MSKCQICKQEDAVSAFQPFGPDEQPHTFMTALGWHYRGFPVIKVCGACHDWIVEGRPVDFMYKGKRYLYDNGNIAEVPGQVEGYITLRIKEKGE